MKPKSTIAIIKEVKKEITYVDFYLKRNKKTLVSENTLRLALDLAESIRDDRIVAIALKKKVKNSGNWPFPNNNL